MVVRKGLFVLSAVCLVGLMSRCQSGGSNEEEARIPVEVMEVDLGEVRQSLAYNGDIAAEFEVMVFSKIPDRIEQYYIDAGDVVKKGETIARVAATAIEQAVRQAEAGLSAAEAQKANMDAEFARAQRLFNEDAMSKQQFDAIQAQYEAVSAQVKQAKAGLATASSQLEDATISAPISGIIGKRYFEAGDMATPGMPVASVVQMNRVKIRFDATEEDLGKLALGQKAEVSVRSYPDRTFSGKVTRISPILDPATRMAAVEVLIPNPKHLLKPGMYAEVEITTGTIENTIVVPRYAAIESTSLMTVNGKDQVMRDYFVYVVNDSSRVDQRKLDVEYVNHQSIAVRSGIQAGETLVISGQNNLRDGVAVQVAGMEEGA